MKGYPEITAQATNRATYKIAQTQNRANQKSRCLKITQDTKSRWIEKPAGTKIAQGHNCAKIALTHYP
jgi:hypothetical protein